MNIPLIINFGISTGAFIMTNRIIPRLKDKFLLANLNGIDVNKKDRPKM